jgi:hypothetical protein
VAPGVFLSPKSGRRYHASAYPERPYRFQSIRVGQLFQYYVSGHKTDAIYNRYDIVDEDDIEAGVLLTQQYLDGDNTVTAIPDGGSIEKDHDHASL